ncbi:hypothetical protein HZS_165 [Henneguya salminicola]|nr:hypothetical protein HZS_165 [Henneguya salminicola]
MHKYFPKNETFYFTILRDPYTQWVSAFLYFRISRIFRFNSLNVIKKFMKKLPMGLLKTLQKHYPILNLIKNPNLFDLGYENTLEHNNKEVGNYVKSLDEDFDLVMYMEDFDSSLLVLKEMLCLDYEDINYLKMNQNILREQKQYDFNGDPEFKQIIYEINSADFFLYKYFLLIFNDYTKLIKSKIEIYQKKLENLYETCIEERINEIAYSNRKYYGYKIKETLTPYQYQKCKTFTTNELNFTKLLCQKFNDHSKDI